MNTQGWSRAIEAMDYAFQPIVSIYSGVCLGYEALLRDWNTAGFANLQDFFDTAFTEKALFQVELALREMAIRKFAKIPFHKKMKLFFNIDNRVLFMPDYSSVSTAEILERYALYPDTVVLSSRKVLPHKLRRHH